MQVNAFQTQEFWIFTRYRAKDLHCEKYAAKIIDIAVESKRESVNATYVL